MLSSVDLFGGFDDSTKFEKFSHVDVDSWICP